MRRTLILVCGLALLAACGSKTDEPGAAEDAARTAMENAKEGVQEGAAAVATTTTIEGTLGCGHCTHHIGESCSAAVQTADGSVYILDGVGEDHEAFQKRFDKLGVKVTGTVTERDGVKHLEVASVDL